MVIMVLYGESEEATIQLILYFYFAANLVSSVHLADPNLKIKILLLLSMVKLINKNN